MTSRRAVLGGLLAGLAGPLLLLSPLPAPEPEVVGGTNVALHEINDRVQQEFAGRPDRDVLAALDRLPPLADERDPLWQDDRYWLVAYRLDALNEEAGRRRLRAAVPKVLARMCYGDPGEMMRLLKHPHEAMFERDELPQLADVYLALATSPRPGTRYWALDGLIRHDDSRARPVFETALRDPMPDIRGLAEIGLWRLSRSGR